MQAFFILIPILLLVFYFIFRKDSRHNYVTLSEEDKQMLFQHVVYYQHLTVEDRLRFEQKISAFLAEVKIEGVGTPVTVLDKLLIASSAVIPVFGFEDWHYRNLTNVLLYPDTFNQDFQYEGGQRNILGMVGSGYMNGQMILSRAALIKGFSNAADKENTAIHEFVHLLDKSDGATDGVPENLMKHEYVVPWIRMIHEEMKRIEKGKSDINPYAITNEAEFFAVVSEYFFEKPDQFKSKHPELYDSLAGIFSQDLAADQHS
ncbi:zinc-dependent peptidase [Pedobacter gandavensis]|uniref:M90 family metallopeptidase n=1 Tax=Pedobacter TaxID=84567 RepID=UPI001C9A230F|nr:MULTISPECIES: M90 family metallopeptidase [Pedobacter]WGQ08030.1 zinc-dependent peptidase [Pedobacter gandavensis]